MLSKLRKKSQGFTIIEVLIVLAIAGLILLIVFLAVPALQRNSRNTSRRNDVAALLGAIQEWQNNNPNTVPIPPATGIQCAFSGTKCNDILLLTKRGIYTDNSAFSVAAAPTTNLGTITNVQISTGATCTSGGDSQTSGATTRSVVILFSVEGNAGSAIKQCQES